MSQLAEMFRYVVRCFCGSSTYKHKVQCSQHQGCICQISLGGVEVLAIEVDDRANA